MAYQIDDLSDLESPISDLRIMTRHVLQFASGLEGVSKMSATERDTLLYLLCDVQEKTEALSQFFYIAFEKDSSTAKSGEGAHV